MLPGIDEILKVFGKKVTDFENFDQILEFLKSKHIEVINQESFSTA